MANDIAGNDEALTRAIKEIHDGVYLQGASNFVDYLFEKSFLLDEYDKAGITYYLNEWKAKFNADK